MAATDRDRLGSAGQALGSTGAVSSRRVSGMKGKLHAFYCNNAPAQRDARALKAPAAVPPPRSRPNARPNARCSGTTRRARRTTTKARAATPPGEPRRASSPAHSARGPVASRRPRPCKARPRCRRARSSSSTASDPTSRRRTAAASAPSPSQRRVTCNGRPPGGWTDSRLPLKRRDHPSDGRAPPTLATLRAAAAFCMRASWDRCLARPTEHRATRRRGS
eukprot:scaffold45676_cov41-Phaeocystis_antarctica.AAC.1